MTDKTTPASPTTAAGQALVAWGRPGWRRSAMKDVVVDIERESAAAAIERVRAGLDAVQGREHVEWNAVYKILDEEAAR